MLGAATCLSALAGIVVLNQIARMAGVEAQSGNPNLWSFIGGTLFFHGAGLAWTHVFLRRHGTGWREGFGLGRGTRASVALWSLLGAGLILPGAMLLGKAASWTLRAAGVLPELQGAVRLLVERPEPWEIFIYGFGAILMAPVAEEALFRGILYPTLKQSGHPALALWTSALIFGASHMNLMAFVPMVFIALVLTWLYERTGNLLVCCLAHALFNAVNFTLLVLKPSLVAPL